MNIILAIMLGYLIGKYVKRREVKKKECEAVKVKAMTDQKRLSKYDEIQTMLDNAIMGIEDMKEGL